MRIPQALLGISLALSLALLGTSCASKAKPSSTPPVASSSLPKLHPTGQVSKGKASYYSNNCNGGSRTASGEPLRDNARTAAHRSLPFGTRVRVTNLNNGRTEVVRITDRGPFTPGRIIDVTIGVAKELDMVKSGVAPVEIEVLRQG